ncbi:MAG: type I restriction-modification system subunit M N-terminal domain-containing protein [Rhodoblastus sp.]
MNHQTLSSFIWSVADLLRGDYKQSDYGKVILPFTVLRRLDCVLERDQGTPCWPNSKPSAKARAQPRALPAAQGRPELLQHVAARPEASSWATRTTSARTSAPTSRPSRPRVRDIFERFDFAHPGRPAGQGRPALPRHREVRQTSTCTPTTVDNAQMGAGLRGADPQVRRTLQRDRRASTSRRARSSA